MRSFNLSGKMFAYIPPVVTSCEMIGDGQYPDLLIRLFQLSFQLKNPYSGIKTRHKLGLIYRLGKIVVRPGFKPFNYIILGIF